MGLVARASCRPSAKLSATSIRITWERLEREMTTTTDHGSLATDQLSGHERPGDGGSLHVLHLEQDRDLRRSGSSVKAYGKRMRQFPDEYPAVELQCRHYIDPRLR